MSIVPEQVLAGIVTDDLDLSEWPAEEIEDQGPEPEDDGADSR